MLSWQVSLIYKGLATISSPLTYKFLTSAFFIEAAKSKLLRFMKIQEPWLFKNFAKFEIGQTIFQNLQTSIQSEKWIRIYIKLDQPNAASVCYIIMLHFIYLFFWVAKEDYMMSSLAPLIA